MAGAARSRDFSTGVLGGRVVLEGADDREAGPTAWGFVGVVINVEDLSGSVWAWHRAGERWAATKVITIPAEPATPDDLWLTMTRGLAGLSSSYMIPLQGSSCQNTKVPSFVGLRARHLSVATRGRGQRMSDRSTPGRAGLPAAVPSGRSATPRYAAFISYSHAVDGKLAPALQSGLQRLAKPWYRLRALRVFRDEASLAANPGLWSSIQVGLDSSRYFILLASPEAARSRWVKREVQYWCSHRERANLLIVLTGGALAWDDVAGDFDWSRTTAVPTSLRGVLHEEPRVVDLLWARTQEHVSLQTPRFRDAVADLAAPLHGRAKDDLVGEDIRQHRRTVRLARSAIASLLVLALLAGGAAVLYADQRNVARSERDVARRQTALATSRQLAAEAEARSVSQPALSALLSVTAYQTADTLEARGGLLRQVERRRDVRGFLAGHQDGARSVAFSPDGQTLASGSLDSTVILWDVRHHTALSTLRGHAGTVLQVAFSPDGQTLASGSTDNTVILWDVRHHIRIATLKGHSGDVYSVAFSPDGKTLASGGTDKAVALWDVRRHTRVATLKDHQDWVTSVAFHPDGRVLASGVADATVQLWDVTRRRERGPPLRSGRTSRRNARVITSVAYNSDGHTLAVGAGPRIGLWHLDGRPRMTVLAGGTRSVQGLAFSPDGATLAAGGGISNAVDLWDIARGAKAQTLEGHTDHVMSVAVSSDGQTVASASLDRTLVLWDVTRGRRSVVDSIGSGEATAVAFSQDGRILAWSSQTAIVLWDVARRARAGILRDTSEGVGAFALSPDGRTLASSGDRDIILWDAVHQARRARLRGHADTVLQVAFSPDGRMLASASIDKTVILWDAVDGSRLATLEGHADEVQTVAFSRDGRTVASGGLDKAVILWDAARGARLASLGGQAGQVAALAFSPDRRTLAAALFPRTIMLWDLERRTQLGSLDAFANSMTFSPDGRTLVAAGDQGATVWDVERRTELASLRDVVYSAAFSPDGRTLAATDRDQEVIIRDFDIGSWQRRLCSIAGRGLTTVEWQDFLPDQPYRRTCG